jgi:hypothetical protein
VTKFPGLMTMAEVAEQRAGKPIPKGPTRLDARIADDKDDKAAERQWRKAVIARAGRVCRCCLRKVVQQLALAGNRLEVHHVAPRADQAVRWDVRNGMVLCSECHQKVTPHSGKLELVILQVARFLFKVGSKTYINASKKVTFQKTAA